MIYIIINKVNQLHEEMNEGSEKSQIYATEKEKISIHINYSNENLNCMNIEKVL